MAQLNAAERAKLPDRAFAYIDSAGKRRLPIYDEAHVRNALARFNQVGFESEHARDVERTRLLRAAKKFRIVPVGFISSQLGTERERGARAADETVVLLSGFVTLLMTDIEGSTVLLDHLGARYGELLTGVQEIHRSRSPATMAVLWKLAPMSSSRRSSHRRMRFRFCDCDSTGDGGPRVDR